MVPRRRLFKYASQEQVEYYGQARQHMECLDELLRTNGGSVPSSHYLFAWDFLPLDPTFGP